MADAARGMTGLLALALISAAALVRLRPAADLDAQSAFDLDRAMAHLRFISSEPHPTGSPHHRGVREYLIRELGSLGLEVDVQDARVKNPRLHNLPMQVVNVLGRVRGTSPGEKAVMLAAHYDSTHVAKSPGAGDDGAAVAALLEVARLLVYDPPRNDVIVFLSDGEERGLLGARAFLDEHPWRGEIGVVFNFEARGVRGPSIMFETSPGNARLIEEYARVAPHPVTSSLSSQIYRFMPNKTDFTLFRERGLRGLNFAFIGGYAHYHRATDDVDHLDPRSLRHHGVQALALARQFGNLDLSSLHATRDAIYFNLVPGRYVIRYSAIWAIPLALGAALLLVLAIVFAIRRGGVAPRGLAASSLMLTLSLATTAAMSWLVLQFLPPGARDRNAEFAIGGFCCLALACTSGLFPLAKHDRERTLMALAIWTTLALVSSLVMASSSYLFTWPAIFGAIGFIGYTAWPGTWRAALAYALASVPLVLILAPISYLAFLAFRVRAAWMTVSVVVLGIWLLSPLLSLVMSRARWTVPILAALAAIALFYSAVSGGGGA